MAIAQATLSTSSTTLYTSSGTTAVTVIYLANSHTSSVTVQLHVVLSSGTATTANRIIKDLTIAAGDTYIMDTERLILGNGDSIRTTASSASVVYSTVSYIGV